ncbi:hypothetical protein B7P43_G10770 [Cryptotermes secundus]|uniref:Uncharacterized protein n=1 Tax=Cryptotermes secundus TaxID=105785 RepID=A0A2J7QKW5_9NEOP|nr:hypothetical protein B7P43_G10770 [Cryptotermes secundus]
MRISHLMKRFLCLPPSLDQLYDPLRFPSRDNSDFTPRQSNQSFKLTTCFHVMLTSRILGGFPLL